MNAIVVGSIGDVAQKSSQSIAHSFVNAKIIAVVDVSGSMAVHDARDGQSRYDVALQELATLQRRNPGEVAVLAFSSKVEFIPGGVPPLFGKGTDLAGALRFAKMADAPGLRFVVISDGQPNDEQTALAAARAIKARIDVVYVGPEGGAGSQFLAQLANTGRGQVAKVSINELSNTVERLALAHGAN